MLRYASSLVLLCATASAQQAPQRDVMLPTRLQSPAPLVVNSHILYLNNCRPAGCHVTHAAFGGTDSRTDHSDIAATGTLSALSTSVNWASVLSCVTNVMAPFNITVTDVDPGMADHFEVMIAGSPNQLGFPNTTGGVADYLCTGAPGQCSSTYIPNALVFDFAQVWGTDINEICATAAQEIAHAWNLDHATPGNDPMTYNMPIQTPIMFRDGAPCGSDCFTNNNTQNTFGVTCAGTGFNGTHLCMETGTSTQNEVQIIKALFGPAGAQPPTVAITTPANGGTEQTMMPFPVTATCTSNDGVLELDMTIDGVLKGTMPASPANFVAPGLADGTHHIQVMCTSKLQAQAVAKVDVIVGHACTTDQECPGAGICYQMACIAGPGDPMGLGAMCASNTDCASGSCASDGTQMLCVVPCDPANDTCPAGFACLATDSGAGVCWLGGDSGGGCCDTRSGGGAGSALISLTLGALWITRRKRS